MKKMSATVSDEMVQLEICKRYEELVVEISVAEDHLAKLRVKSSKLFDEMVRLSERYKEELRRVKINEALREHENESKERNQAGRRNGAHWNRVTEQAELERMRNTPDVYAAARAPEQTTISGDHRPTGEREDHGDARPDQEPVRPS